MTLCFGAVNSGVHEVATNEIFADFRGRAVQRSRDLASRALQVARSDLKHSGRLRARARDGERCEEAEEVRNP